MLRKIYDWLDHRLDITPMWRGLADHEVPEHVNPAHYFSAFIYCFGGLTFFIVVIQILSGMFLTMYYVPDIVHAHASVKYLQNEVAFGQIVRGMHHWGASVAIVMLFLHTLRVFFTGAYKHPAGVQLGDRHPALFCDVGARLHRLPAAVGQQGVLRHQGWG